MTLLTIMLAAVIGVSDQCPPDKNGRDVRVRANYCTAIVKSGHLPLVISRFGDDKLIEEAVSRIDALVIPGGEDINPERYGDNPHPKLGKMNKERDDFDFRLFAAARRRGIPILGICRGCQLVNVACGGTLHQDIPSEYPESKLKHNGEWHRIKLAPESRLAKLLGVTDAEVNSYHHQCAKKLAPGFRVVARAEDGVVEAIESEREPIIGLQFHPEIMIHNGESLLFLPLFKILPSLDKGLR